MRKTVTRSVLTAALALGLAMPAAAAIETWTIDRDHSTVGFQVRHLVSNVRGQFGAFRGTVRLDPQQPEKGAVEFTIDAASIDTNHAQRDEHLRAPDFFDVAHHPQITFKSNKVVPLGANRFAVAGTLNMRGVAREVTLPVELLGTSKDPWGHTRAGFSTALTLNRKDYGIEWNKALDGGGLLLGEDVQIDIQLEAIREQPAAAR
jgi:polyisoprenoid-binding protein YceI